MLHHVPHGDNLLTDQSDLAITGDRRQQADRCGKLEFQQRRRAIQFHSFDGRDAFEIAALRWVRSAEVSFGSTTVLPRPPRHLKVLVRLSQYYWHASERLEHWPLRCQLPTSHTYHTNQIENRMRDGPLKSKKDATSACVSLSGPRSPPCGLHQARYQASTIWERETP